MTRYEKRLKKTIPYQHWDEGEGSGWLRAVNKEPLPGNDPKAVLIQCAQGDGQVSTWSAHIQARAYGAVQLQYPLRDIYGVVSTRRMWVPDGSSAVVEYGFPDVSVDPLLNVPPVTDSHGRISGLEHAQQQVQEFLTTGVIWNHCEGPPTGHTCYESND